MGSLSRRSLGSVARPWFLFELEANFELTPLFPPPALGEACNGGPGRPRLNSLTVPRTAGADGHWADAELADYRERSMRPQATERDPAMPLQ